MMTKFKCNKQLYLCNKKCNSCFSEKLHIVSLYGRDKKGKTPTLCRLIDIMCTQSHQFKCLTSMSKKATALDKTFIFEFIRTGKRVGVTTTGDTCYCLAKEFEWMRANNGDKDCDLYVCASHINGSTVNWLQDRTKYGYLLRLSKIAIEKSQGVPNKTVFYEHVINQHQAEYLYEVIVSLL